MAKQQPHRRLRDRWIDKLFGPEYLRAKLIIVCVIGLLVLNRVNPAEAGNLFQWMIVILIAYFGFKIIFHSKKGH